MGLIIFICFFVFVFVGNIILNYLSLQKPRYKLNHHYIHMDRYGNKYINNKKVFDKVFYDENGNRHHVLTDSNNKIYHDTFDDDMKNINNHNKKSYNISQECKTLSYLKYYPKYKKSFETEIYTDKMVSLRIIINNKGEKIYQKIYFKNGDKSNFTDADIKNISKEDYYKYIRI